MPNIISATSLSHFSFKKAFRQSQRPFQCLSYGYCCCVQLSVLHSETHQSTIHARQPFSLMSTTRCAHVNRVCYASHSCSTKQASPSSTSAFPAVNTFHYETVKLQTNVSGLLNTLWRSVQFTHIYSSTKNTILLNEEEKSPFNV